MNWSSQLWRSRERWGASAAIGAGVLAILGVLVDAAWRCSSGRQRMEETLVSIQTELAELRQGLGRDRQAQEQQIGAEEQQTQQLATVKETVRQLDARLRDIDEIERAQRQEVELAQTAAAHALALGVDWKETAGTNSWRLCGTGFPVGDGRICVTAGHVVEELVRLCSDLKKRGLAPRLLVTSSTGQVFTAKRYALHHSLQASEEALIDLGALGWDGTAPPTQPPLQWSTAEMGTGAPLVAAGYPVESPGIAYALRFRRPMLYPVEHAVPNEQFQ